MAVWSEKQPRLLSDEYLAAHGPPPGQEVLYGQTGRTNSVRQAFHCQQGRMGTHSAGKSLVDPSKFTPALRMDDWWKGARTTNIFRFWADRKAERTWGNYGKLDFSRQNSSRWALCGEGVLEDPTYGRSPKGFPDSKSEQKSGTRISI